MTPKEKAKELFGKYAMYLRANLRYDEEANEDAKVCALIAVDEIIQTYHSPMDDEQIQEWEEVKQEINNF
jgi:hypothetical protein